MEQRLRKVLVYNGKGSGTESSRLLLTSLCSSLKKGLYDVKYVSAEEIIRGSWISNCQLIAFGGGYDRGFIKALGSSGIKKIRDFVSSGGLYLGMCAGAYFACDYIQFDKDGPLEVVGNRDLKFYPGSCIGPAFPGFCYNSKRGVHPVPIKYKDKPVFDSYMEGGGFFLPHRNKHIKPSHPPTFDNTFYKSDLVKVLGHFTSLPDCPAAVVKCKVGDGAALLSGVHLEYIANLLDKNDSDLQKLIPTFLESDVMRDNVFRDMLNELGLDVQICQSNL